MVNIQPTQNYNQQLSYWLYNVQAPTPELTDKDKVIGLGQEIMYGAPIAMALPLAGKPFGKPYAAFKAKGEGMSYMDAWKKVTEDRIAEKKSLEYLKDKNSLWNTYKNKNLYNQMNRLGSELPVYNNSNIDISKISNKKLIKLQNQNTISAYYSEAKRLIQEAKDKKMTGSELKEQLKKIREAVRAGDAKVNIATKSGLIKQSSKIGKFGHFVKSKTGYYNVKGSMLKSARGSAGLRLAAKGVKGSWLMALFEGAIEIPDIIKSYNIDKEERAKGNYSNRGNKQLAKSGAKVGASVLGYAAGAAAAGAIAGSVVPGIGNVAGAVVGFVGGLIGGFVASWGVGKLMDKATGEKNSLDKTEVELYAEEQNLKNEKEAKKLAYNAEISGQMQDQLLQAAEQKAQEEGGAPEEILAAYELALNARESELQTNGGKKIMDLLGSIAEFAYN